MNVMRRSVLTVADSQTVERFCRTSRLTRGLINRFVAGETLDEALAAAADIQAQRMTTTLDLLGENVTTPHDAERASAAYIDILRRMRADGLEPNISIKLTMLGLDLGDDVALENLKPILEAAKDVGGFVRIDMESSAYTERTMDILTDVHARFPGCVGTVVQSYLRRAEADVRHAIAIGVRLRLVKGAYAEPETIAFQSRREVDANFVTLMRLLLDAGPYPAIATHDPALI
ncbi:MAG: proline dehydrogenase family protein, partial [Chloroflexota bacterium]|nr:proline dehydrogenase family protein [Chloroflexota bacterium]